MAQLAVESLATRIHIADLYATEHTTQHAIGLIYGVGQATINRYIKEVCYIIVDRLHNYYEDDAVECAAHLAISLDTVTYAIERVNREMKPLLGRRVINASN